MAGELHTIRNTDAGDGVEQINIMRREWVRGECMKMQAGIYIFSRMGLARCIARFATFHGHRRAKRVKGKGLHTLGQDEIGDIVGKHGRQIKPIPRQAIDTGIMRVQPRIIVDIKAGKNILRLHSCGQLSQHRLLGAMPCRSHVTGNWPYTVIIRLTIQHPQALFRRRHIAHE